MSRDWRGSLLVTSDRLPAVGTSVHGDQAAQRIDETNDKSDGSPARLTWTESSFELFFFQNYSRVIALLMRIVGDRARAEELADDAFFKLYRQSLSANREHNLGAWLYRTASRMGIDALRAAERRTRFEAAAAAADDRRSAGGDCPLGNLLLSEEQMQVRTALARLKPAEAQMLILRSSGFSYKEIADAMAIRPTSVGTLLNRAESAFEKVFRELFGAE